MSDLRDTGPATIVALVERKNPLGRTAVMKLCYFLQTLRQVPLAYRFTLYSYGPFDANVLSDISSAEALGGLLSKVVFYSNGYGYAISPGVNGDFVKSLASDFISKYAVDLDWVVEQFGDFGSADLELLSTIVYVNRETVQGEASPSSDVLTQKVHEIKPHFTVPYVQSKVEFLKHREFLRSVNTLPAAR